MSKTKGIEVKTIEVKAIIYKVTNLVNGKIYIGKTKTHYGTKPHGIKGRIANHFTKALNNDPKGCPGFYNAIRKYGKKNFKIEEILRCDEKDVDENEMEQIEIHKATDKEIGYNIALGGGGRSVVNVSEEIRKKISSNKGKSMNLTKVFRKGVHVGYSARRRDKGNQYQKWFISSKNTVAENKRLAKEWLKNFRDNGVIGKSDYNKESKLPRNISRIKDNGKHVGYQLSITRNGKNVYKRFQNKAIPLEKLLEKAVKFRDNYLNNLNKVKIDE